MEIDIASPDGNALAIMGYTHELIKAAGRGDEWPDIQQRMKGGNYDNLCKIAEEETYGSITFYDSRKD